MARQYMKNFLYNCMVKNGLVSFYFLDPLPQPKPLETHVKIYIHCSFKEEVTLHDLTIFIIFKVKMKGGRFLSSTVGTHVFMFFSILQFNKCVEVTFLL